MDWISVLDRLPMPGDPVLAWVCSLDNRHQPAGPCFPRTVYYSAAAGWRDVETHRRLYAEFWCVIVPPTAPSATPAGTVSRPAPATA